ncbi:MULTISPECIES: hypothetical protein [unclassified Paenibacillus]|uniref:hypothetical protein n=1 Tax=unclassified Paenibacillus TaxID=185978 RepID=UPI00363A3124
MSWAKLERNLNKLNGFFEDMAELGLRPYSKIIKFEKREPNQKEQHQLNLKKVYPPYHLCGCLVS